MYRFCSVWTRKVGQYSDRLLASYGLRTYLQAFTPLSDSYGSLAGVMALLFWLYVSGAALVVGGEFNASFGMPQTTGADTVDPIVNATLSRNRYRFGRLAVIAACAASLIAIIAGLVYYWPRRIALRVPGMAQTVSV